MTETAKDACDECGANLPKGVLCNIYGTFCSKACIDTATGRGRSNRVQSSEEEIARDNRRNHPSHDSPAGAFVYAVGSNKKNKFTTDRIFGPQNLAEAEQYCRERNTNNRIHASPAWWTVMKAPLGGAWTEWETVYADDTPKTTDHAEESQ